MSVIAGIAGFDGHTGQDAVHAMASALDFVVAHREAVWVGEDCAMVAKRLVVEDRDQTVPFIAPMGSGIAVAIDGHLFNRPELADSLALDRDTSDEGLIAASWHKWGDAFPAKLNGEFALAAWDTGQRRLLLAADHVSTTPLYYTGDTRGCVVFSTELEAIIATEISTEPDWEKIADYLARSPDGEARTFIAGIAAVPAGCAVVYANGNTRNIRYWDFATVAAPGVRNADDGIDHFRALLRRAVCRRLPSGCGVASHLTGGLDSSAVAAIAAQELGPAKSALHLYSVIPEPVGGRVAEGDTAMIPAFLRMYPECPHAYVFGQLQDSYPLPGLTNGPLRLGLTAALKDVAAQTKQIGIRVMLSGLGGEAGASFLGRGVYWTAWRQRYWRWLLREMMVAETTWRGRARWCWRRVVRERTLADLERKSHWEALCRELAPEFLTKFQMKDRCLARKHTDSDPQLDAQMQQLAGAAGRLESWAHQGRAEGFRYRYPLLDRELLEGVRGLPPSVHIDRGRRRELMRRAVERWLPHEITSRRDKQSALVAPSAVRSNKTKGWEPRVDTAWPWIGGMVRRTQEAFTTAFDIEFTTGDGAAGQHLRGNIVAVGNFLRLLDGYRPHSRD